MSTAHDPTGSFSLLDALVAAYLQGVEAGEAPDRRDLIARHPDLAEPLLAFFADLDRIDRVAAPFRLDAAPNPPATVRYFGDYELIEEVARGGMGIVYRARQVSLNRVVALKMVLAGGHASPRAVQRFRLEAEAAANLDHPHIVPIHEVGDHEGIPYYSMKFVDGVPLGQAPRGTFRDEAAALATVARAVHHAHHHGVLHRDLKPANVLVDPKLGWLVTDFGLAKRLTDVDAGLTETGDILGTPRYMAPEQAAGRRDLTVAADVYSLGAILFERLTGRPPFLADNVVTLLHQVRESDPPRPSTLVPGLGKDLETIVLKCLDKDPGRRYATAEDLALDLANWVEGRPIAARPVGKVGKTWRWCKRNPVVAGLMATVAASMVAGTAVSIAFAVKAEARALDAGMAGTRANILLAQGLVEPDPIQRDGSQRATDLGLLTYARAFGLAPAHRSADDLRWCIVANLAMDAQKRRPLILNRGEGTADRLSTLSPDGSRCATVSPEGIVRVREVPDGRLVSTLPRNPGGVMRMVFSPNGRRLAIVPNPKHDRLWEDSLLIGNGTWKAPILSSVSSTADHAVRVVEVATGEIQAVLPHDSTPDYADFSDDSERLFTWIDAIGRSPKMFLWDVADARPLVAATNRKPLGEIDNRSFESDLNYNGTPKRIRRVEQSPDGTIIALRAADYANGSFTNGYWLHDARTGVPLRDIPGEFLAWSPDGREIATVEKGEEKNFRELPYRLHFWEVASGRSLSTTSTEWVRYDSSEGISGEKLKYSPDGRFIFYTYTQSYAYSCFFDTFARVWGQAFPRQAGGIPEFSPDGSIALAGGQAYDAMTWQRLRPPEGRRFHPSLRGRAKLGRLFTLGGEMWDLSTEFQVGTGSDKIPHAQERPEGYAKERPDGLVSYYFDTWRWLPREPFASDPRTLQLWTEVLVRQRLVGESEVEPLTEAEWEGRRLELLRRLPASASPLLTNLATDRAHWRREEAKLVSNKSGEFAQTLIELVQALDRLIEIEPTWYYRHSRGLAQAKLLHWDRAARDFLAAGREAGEWYWDHAPAILDEETLNSLLLDEHPEQTLRESLHYGSEVTEVAMRHLSLLQRDDYRLREAVLSIMTRPNPSNASIKRALEITERATRNEPAELIKIQAYGLTLYRARRYQEARDYLEKVVDKFEWTLGVMDPQFHDKSIICSILSMCHAQLDRLKEARDTLNLVAHDGDSDNRLLNEAKALILDHGFPADPFAR